MDEIKQPKQKKGFFPIFIVSAIWLVGMLAAGNTSSAFNGWILIFLYFVAIRSAFLANGHQFFPFVIFLMYCFASNAGQTLSHLLGFEEQQTVEIYKSYSDGLIAEMLFLQMTFVLSMILGYLLLRKARPVTLEATQLSAETTEDALTIGVEEVILWVMALYVAVIYIQELSQRSSLSYGDYYYSTREGVGAVAQYLYHVVVFAYLFKHRGWKRKMALGIAITLAIMAVFIGSRSATLPILVGLLFVLSALSSKQFKLRLRHVIVGIVVLLVFSAFAVLRNYPISQLSISLIADKVTLDPVKALVEILQEMGGSARTTLSTMTALKNGVVHHEGTILYSLLKGIFPIPILNLVGISAPAIESLSAWISDYGSGSYLDGKGWGYSFIAEIIYNYGNWGFLCSFVFGAVLAVLENCIEKLLNKKNYYLAAGILYILGYGVFLARAETTLLSTRIRYTVYMALLFAVYYLLTKKKGRNNL